MKVNKSNIRLYANPKAVIAQYLHLPGKDRVHHIIERVSVLPERQVDQLIEQVMRDFGNRHRDIEKLLFSHFELAKAGNEAMVEGFSERRRLLLGALFTKEYSIQSAALFNPSIVPHPDQTGLREGEQRFVMSLRATGEGHISSIAFCTGVVGADGAFALDEPSPFCTALRRNPDALYCRDSVLRAIGGGDAWVRGMMEGLGECFTAGEFFRVAEHALAAHTGAKGLMEKFQRYFDSNYELTALPDVPLNERVIFPSGRAESMGMEDVRLVAFNEGGNTVYYGTYTAYDGKQIRSQLIETADFSVFRVHTLYGAAVSDKGMALLPEKVNGKYVIISRQGGEKINIMFSSDLYQWDDYQTLLEPEFDWELVQLGNCGSPIRTDRGWLLLTHGVGVMRTYVISALLLDLHDPSKIVARLTTPILQADDTEREGYVPNVAYTCGLLEHGANLLIPYAVSDSAIGFATVGLIELLDEMKTSVS